MRAVKWGFGVALAHRLLLGIWMALIWSVLSPYLNGAQTDFHAIHAEIPALTTPADQLIFGVWRRWDAVHYFNLATNGYRPTDPGPTVFGILTPFAFRAFDAVLPGSIDLAAMLFETLAFGLALTLVYKVGETYYADADLGRWALILTAILPLSFFFAAPLSESIYLAMSLGVFYFGAKRQWLGAAVCGALATLARSQGVLLFPIAVLLLLEQNGFRLRDRTRWLDQTRRAITQGWALALIPLAFVGFIAYRTSLGLPSLQSVYRDISFNYFTNPLDGLLTNFAYFISHPEMLLTTVEPWALLISLILAFVALRFLAHRRLPLVAYSFGFILLFASRINYVYGTDEVAFTQSFGRYALTLFPLTFLVADGLRAASPLIRILGIAVLLIAALTFSALYVLGLTSP